MAPSKSAKKDSADPRVLAVLDCAKTARTVLQDRSTLPTALLAQVEAYVKQNLPNLKSTAIARRCRELDTAGTDLWNFSAHLFHQDDTATIGSDAHSGVVIRVFALLLLTSTHAVLHRHNTDTGQRVRVMKVALRTARLCLDREELDLASTALQVCSDFVPIETEETVPLIRITDDPKNDDPADKHGFSSLVMEYYLFRMLHSWKSQRLDLAEHFYSKIPASSSSAHYELAFKKADLLYDIARSLVKAGQLEVAANWFERALSTLDGCDTQAVSQDVEELRLCIGVSFVDLLVKDEKEKSRARSWEILSQLESTHGLYNRIAVQAVRLQILATERQIDSEQILQTLLRIVKMTVLTEGSFATTMKLLRQASKASLPSALHALADLICTRLLPELQTTNSNDQMIQAWLEKATIAYILIARSPPRTSPDEAIAGIRELLNHINDELRLCFTAKATHAAQTLIWQAAAEPKVMEWLHLLQHPVFENAGHLNKARVGRKLMRHAIDQSDYPAARETFLSMTKSAQDDSITRYLALKLALQTQDEAMAMESLMVVTRKSDKDPTYLYACVIEAQKSSMRHMGVAALQAIIAQRPQGINLAALLRCTARLLITELEAAGQDQNEVATQVIDIFENAVRSVDELRRLSGDSWQIEALWWSKNAYNLAIRLCTSITAASTVRLVDACLAFMDSYPHDHDGDRKNDIDHRRMLCAFLATSALLVLGRSGQLGDESTLQSYLHAQGHIQLFKSYSARLQGNFQGGAAIQHEQRAFAVLKFELECILKLRQWESLEAALQACLNSSTSGHWDTLADIVIIIHDQLDAHARDSTVYTLIRDVLQRAVDDSWRAHYDLAKIARWLRFTFTLCIAHTQSDFSHTLLLQAVKMAESGRLPGKDEKEIYPDAELQWLATKSFNHAVDLIVGGEGEAAVKWMEGALELARYARDEGALHALFTEKRKMADERARITRE